MAFDPPATNWNEGAPAHLNQASKLVNEAGFSNPGRSFHHQRRAIARCFTGDCTKALLEQGKLGAALEEAAEVISGVLARISRVFLSQPRASARNFRAAPALSNLSQGSF